MEEKLIKQALEQQQALMYQIEVLISKLYAVKDYVDHLYFWHAVTTLEIYKTQYAILFDLFVNHNGKVSHSRFKEIQNLLEDQWKNIAEMLKPLFKMAQDRIESILKSKDDKGN